MTSTALCHLAGYRQAGVYPHDGLHLIFAPQYVINSYQRLKGASHRIQPGGLSKTLCGRFVPHVI